MQVVAVDASGLEVLGRYVLDAVPNLLDLFRKFEDFFIDSQELFKL